MEQNGKSRALAGVLTVSDSAARGEREDVSGDLVVKLLTEAGFRVISRELTPDERPAIADRLRSMAARCALIVTTGGTGVAPRDTTPEATADVIERDVPGIAEMLRFTGFQRNPRAVLSRGRCGILGKTLILNLPGSPSGTAEGLEVVLPLLPHTLALLRDEPVDHS